MLCSVPINDLQPHTKLTGNHEALQLGKTGTSYTQRVPHSLLKSLYKVTQPNICGNFFSPWKFNLLRDPHRIHRHSFKSALGIRNECGLFENPSQGFKTQILGWIHIPGLPCFSSDLGCSALSECHQSYLL